MQKDIILIHKLFQKVPWYSFGNLNVLNIPNIYISGHVKCQNNFWNAIRSFSNQINITCLPSKFLFYIYSRWQKSVLVGYKKYRILSMYYGLFSKKLFSLPVWVFMISQNQVQSLKFVYVILVFFKVNEWIDYLNINKCHGRMRLCMRIVWCVLSALPVIQFSIFKK